MFSPCHIERWVLISKTKYELIIKLITQVETDLRDEFIKPN
jgi:hypothetical protein